MESAQANPARLELLSAPGCHSCRGVYRRLQKRLAEQPELPVMLEQVDILDDLDRAVELGVLYTPAVVLDDRLIAQGARLDVEAVLAAATRAAVP